MIKDDNGDELWILNIKSDDAEGYQFLFDKFYLPEHCKLYFYNEEKNMTLGAFTSENNRDDNQFVTQFINGSSIFIELYIPVINKEKVKLSLSKVVYIFNDVFRKGPYSKDGADICHINTSCSQGNGWSSEIKSVALILEKTGNDYWGVCTGALINKENNYMDTDKPFLLSANHCYENPENGNLSDVNNWVFLFRHETAFCSSDGSEIQKDLTKSVVGAEIISRKNMNSGSDYLLLKLKNTVGQIRNFDISFAGWNGSETGSGTAQAVGIHHPMGDVKKISISNKTPISATLNQGTCKETSSTSYNYLKIIWDEGITAPGSSGSPLFNQNHQLIGTLQGGFSWCTNKPDELCPDINGPQGPDFYGKFSKSWSDGNLKQYLTPTSGANSLNAYEPPIYYELSISIETSPKNVFLGTAFKVEAISTNGENPIQWYLWINKNPDDFSDYQYGSANCYNENKSTNNNVFESTNSYSFAKSGNYKSRIYAVDASGRQSTTDFVITVAEKKDPCIFTHFYQTECAKQLEFPKGANIRLYDYCYVTDNVSYSPDACHEIKFIGSEYIQPKYQGISKLKWFFDNKQIGSDINFNTTWEHQYQPGYPSNPMYYYQTGYSKCFSLDTEGEHTIRLEAYGGRMSSDGYQFKHPFTLYNSYSSVTKKIKVIDCDKNILITTKSQLSSYNGNIIGGYVTLNPANSITVDRGETHNITAYREVVLKSGTHIKSGANFSIKMLKCPEYKCDCNTTKPTSMPSFSERPNLVLSDKDFGIRIYPNPANTRLIIEFECNENEKTSVEFINSIGQIIQVYTIFDRKNEINIGDLPLGLYIVRIQKNNMLFYRKILKE